MIGRKTSRYSFWIFLWLVCGAPTVVAQEAFVEPMVFDEEDLLPPPMVNPQYDRLVPGVEEEFRQWQSNQWKRYRLPDGLLYRSNLAGPKEPRHSIVTTADRDGNLYSDATLGGRIGFIRFGTPGSVHAEGWQWDFEGAVVTRMNHLENEDVDAIDYRFGTLITHATGNWSHKFGYSHWSSHVGDELMVRTQSFDRINYVTESLIFGSAYQWSEPVRLYGEMAVAVKASGGAKHLQFQFGAEYATWQYHRPGVPFAAINVDLMQVTNYEPNITIQAGWLWNAHHSGRRMRFGGQFYNGRSNQYSFFAQREQSYGLGLWFDY